MKERLSGHYANCCRFKRCGPCVETMPLLTALVCCCLLSLCFFLIFLFTSAYHGQHRKPSVPTYVSTKSPTFVKLRSALDVPNTCNPTIVARDVLGWGVTQYLLRERHS
jgi:hypothetical protein